MTNLFQENSPPERIYACIEKYQIKIYIRRKCNQHNYFFHISEQYLQVTNSKNWRKLSKMLIIRTCMHVRCWRLRQVYQRTEYR